VSQLDLKRCQHCVHPIATVMLDDSDAFQVDSPLLVCYRCDRRPHPEVATFAPDWDETA
jgi:hypothetical protein